jgi:hypothetical protein
MVRARVGVRPPIPNPFSAKGGPMASKWSVSGNYFETCNCDYLCPCISSNLAAKPTHGDCKVALAFQVDKGNFDGVSLDGLGNGQWTVGLILDERANAKQREALTGIATGQAGGPMSALGPLISKVAGVEARPIAFKHEGKKWSVSVKGMVEQSVEPMPSPSKPDEALYLDNTLHPANPRIALAKSTGTKFDAFGIKWDHPGGGNNGHIAPFRWTGG